MGVCNCSMFCCTLLYVHSSIAIILMGKREMIALLNLSSWCLVMVERLFLAVPRGCLQFVIVVFPDHTHLLFFFYVCKKLNFNDLAAGSVCLHDITWQKRGVWLKRTISSMFVFNHGSQKHFHTNKNENWWHLCRIFHIVGKMWLFEMKVPLL